MLGNEVTNKIKPEINYYKYSLCLALLSCIFLFLVIVFFSPSSYIYDENNFIPNIETLRTHGLSLTFIYNIKNQSPGPLYQIIYYVLGFGEQSNPVAMRLVNCFFLYATMISLFYYFKATRFVIPFVALFLMSAPMTWVVSGMALTEVFAMFFMVLGIMMLYLCLFVESNGFKSSTYSMLGGLFLGLSIIGRAPYLMILFIIPFLFFFSRNYVSLIIYIIATSYFPLIVFGTWGGLTPPDVQNVQSGYNFFYGFLALGYQLVITLFISYKWLIVPVKYYIYSAMVLICAAVFNISFQVVSFDPLRTLAAKIPMVFFQDNYKYLMPAVLIWMGVLFIVIWLYNFLNKSKTFWDRFILICGILILLTTIKSSAQFSSRYVVQALPLFLISYSSCICFNKTAISLQALGVSFGIASLLSYYFL